jgi:hypothetical protein
VTIDGRTQPGFAGTPAAATPPDFVLETATNLMPVIVWLPVTNSVGTNGPIKYVILNVNAAEPERYFRLRQ